MRDYFVLDGKPSSDFGVFLATSNFLNGASHDAEEVEVPGRNGALTISNDRFHNFELEATVYTPWNVKENMLFLKEWLGGHSDTYYHYEESLDAEYFRMVRFSETFEVDTHDSRRGSAVLKFSCKPQKFLRTGDIPLDVTSGDVFFNPTLFDALPLISVTGAGTITIGDDSITVTNTTRTEIDCDIQECYEGSVNRNNKVVLSNAQFPKLKPGENEVTFTGFTSVKITPRWWRL